MSAIQPSASPPTLGTRVVRGISITFLRTVAVYLILGAASIALTKILTPADFGTYAVIGSLNVLIYQAAASGFTTAFIAQHEGQPEEVNAVFWMLQMVFFPVAIVLLLAAWLADSGDLSVFLACAAAFVVAAPFRFPASVRLNLRLSFGRLAIVELSELAAFTFSSVLFAFLGQGVLSFAYATLVAAVALILAVIIVAGWTPGRPALQPALRWRRPALPYFYNSWVHLAREVAFIPALAVVLTPSELGLYSWALSAAVLVLVITGVTTSVIFPALAQARDDRHRVYEAVSLAIRMNATISIGLAAALAASLPTLIPVVFSPRWLPAMTTCRVLIASMVAIVILAPAWRVIQVYGQTTVLTRWEIVFFVVMWSGGLPAAAYWGPIGAAWVYLGAAMSTLALGWRYCHRHYDLHYTRQVGLAVLAGVAASVVGDYLVGFLPETLWSVVAAAVAVLIIYSALLLLLTSRSLLEDARESFLLFRG